MSTDIQPPSSIPVLPEDATARLMRMLESVRLEKSDHEDDHNSPPQKTACPQCNSEEPWGTSPWCPECGYYPKLGRAMTPVEIDANKEQKPLVSRQWGLWLTAGALVFLGLSFLTWIFIPDETTRASYGRVQFVLGAVLLLTGQIRAYLVSTHLAGAVPISAIFFEPFQLWLAVCRQLPQSRHVLYSGTWGLTIMILALSVTGMDIDGMCSGLRPRKKRKNTMQSIVKAISAANGASAFSSFDDEEAEDMKESETGSMVRTASGNRNQDLGSAIKELTGAAGVDAFNKMGNASPSGQPAPGNTSEQFTDAEHLPDTEQVAAALGTMAAKPKQPQVPRSPSGQVRTDHTEFIIFGYLTNPAGEIRSVLLADVSSKRARFAGRMSLDELSDAQRREVQSVLDQVRSSRPALKAPHQARWVRPIVIARVAHVGWTPTGQLHEGYLVSIDNSQMTRQVTAQQDARP